MLNPVYRLWMPLGALFAFSLFLVSASAVGVVIPDCYEDLGGGICEAVTNCSCINQALNDTNCTTVQLGESITANATCVIFPDDDKTLDGAGYTLTGDGDYGDSGVVASGKTNVTVKNLGLSTFFFAINIRYCTDVNVTNNTVTGSDTGLDFWETNDSSATDNDFSGNDYAGLRMYFATNCTAEGNTLGSNGGNGLTVSGGSSNTIRDNDANENDYCGIGVYNGAMGIVIDDNDANLNGYPGIFLNSSDSNNITGNTANGNGEDDDNSNNGIYLYNSTNNLIYDNTAQENTWAGIELWEGSDLNNITGNDLSSNDVSGIYIETSDNNILDGNTLDSNEYAQIYIYYSGYNNLTNNEVTDGLGGVLVFEGSYNRIINNTLLGDWQSDLDDGWYGVLVVSETPTSSEYNTIANNTITEYLAGILLYDTQDNEVINNTATDGLAGILTLKAYFNNITENNLTGNAVYSLADIGFGYCNFVGNVSNIGGDEGKPILYLYNTSGVNISDTDAYSEIIFCNVSNSLISNVTLSNPGTYSDGIFISYSDNNTINDSTVTDSFAGIVVRMSLNNTVGNNTVSETFGGIAIINSMRDDMFSDALDELIDSFIDGGFYYILSAPEENLLQENALDWTMFDNGRLNKRKAVTNMMRLSEMYNALKTDDTDELMHQISAIGDSNALKAAPGPSSSGSNLIIDNTVDDNEVFGIIALLSLNDTISGNSVSDNGLMGIASYFNILGAITENTASNNGLAGIAIAVGAGITITDNTANYNNLDSLGFFAELIAELIGDIDSGWGLALGSTEVEANSNTFCYNDIDILNYGEGSGVDNTCQYPEDWDDTDADGCTDLCYPWPEEDDDDDDDSGGALTGWTLAAPTTIPPVEQPPVQPPVEEAGLNVRLLDEPMWGDEFEVIVTDDEGNPVEGAEVSYAGKTVLTDATGKATLLAVAGVRMLTAEKPSYGPAELEVTVTPQEQAPPTKPISGQAIASKKQQGAGLELLIPLVVIAALIVVAFLFIKKKR